MEIELFMGIFATMCIGMGISGIIALKEDNIKAFWVVLGCYCIGVIVLFSIAAYMAPSWMSEMLSDVVIPY